MIKTKILSRLIKSVEKKYALWRTEGNVILLAETISKGLITGIILHTDNPKFIVGDRGNFLIVDFEPFDGKIYIENNGQEGYPRLMSKKPKFLSFSKGDVQLLVIKKIEQNYYGVALTSRDFKYDPFVYDVFDVKDFEVSIDTVTLINTIL